MIDLHSHTYYSDGSLSPLALMSRASQLGIRHLAITDHDCLAVPAQVALAELTPPDDVQLIAGIELSTGWEQQEIHVLGLLINPQQSDLQQLAERQQDARRRRAEAIGIKLERAGISGLSSWLLTQPCLAVGRNHVADFLLERGVVGSKQQAFTKYLARRGRAYVSADWCSIEEAVEAIHKAGGVALLAHPERYPLSRPRFRRLLDEFVSAGGDGLEVSYSNLNIDSLQFLAKQCEERQLWASVGSDFHTPEHHWMELGKIRRLPAVCRERAIWHHPLWQQHAGPVSVDG